MKNILKFNYCFGCGVCSLACPKKIISIRQNEDGFYKPYIDDLEQCIGCGLCLKVCAFDKNLPASLPNFEIKSFAVWSNDEVNRHLCSSGGVGFELGRMLIENGYRACGVRYNLSNHRAEHFIASTVEEYLSSIGSKYIPSYTVDAFSSFEKGVKYFVTGCPCQIDSLRHYIRRKKIEDNFVLMDFFCHGVPSLLMWDKYLEGISKSVKDKASGLYFRNKKYGWHDSWAIGLDDNMGCSLYFSLMSKGDLFYKFFLGNKCLGKACYKNCKYKMLNSSADIRIGDLWGTTYANNEKGVNGVLVFTSKGKEILDNLSFCTIEHCSVQGVTESQMKKNAFLPYSYEYIKKHLRMEIDLPSIYKSANRMDFIHDRIPALLKYYIKRLPYKLGLK